VERNRQKKEPAAARGPAHRRRAADGSGAFAGKTEREARETFKTHASLKASAWAAREFDQIAEKVELAMEARSPKPTNGTAEMCIPA